MYEVFFNTGGGCLRHLFLKGDSEVFKELVEKRMYRNTYAENITIINEEGVRIGV